MVSRRHCRIACDGVLSWTVEDLGAANGTNINGEAAARVPLHAGDVLCLGACKGKFVSEAQYVLMHSTVVG